MQASAQVSVIGLEEYGKHVHEPLLCLQLRHFFHGNIGGEACNQIKQILLSNSCSFYVTFLLTETIKLCFPHVTCILLSIRNVKIKIVKLQYQKVPYSLHNIK